MVDPYDREEQMRRQEKLNHRARILHPFRSTTNYGTTFNTNWQVYRKINTANRKLKQAGPSIHDRPFKPTNPSKHGHEKTF